MLTFAVLIVMGLLILLRFVIMKNWFTRVHPNDYMQAANQLLISKPHRGQNFCWDQGVYYMPEFGVHIIANAGKIGIGWSLFLVGIDRVLGILMWLSALLATLRIIFLLQS